MPSVDSSERASNTARAAANPESINASPVSSPTIALKLADLLHDGVPPMIDKGMIS
jgi:hypothetical protein